MMAQGAELGTPSKPVDKPPEQGLSVCLQPLNYLIDYRRMWNNIALWVVNKMQLPVQFAFVHGIVAAIL